MLKKELKNLLLVCGLVSLTTLSACSENRKNVSPIPSVSEETKQEMAKPVDCATAKEDIAVLESEKASVGRQMVAGVRSVFPIAAVAGLLTGDYNDRAKVATGQYNDDLEKKIRQIRVTCKVL